MVKRTWAWGRWSSERVRQVRSASLRLSKGPTTRSVALDDGCVAVAGGVLAADKPET
jgi:hypothetical protein